MQKINDRLLSWASDIDDGTIRQAEKTARLPVVFGHVALMADAHVGLGSTVGSVIPTRDAIIPSAVGVDIGCGMIASRLNVTSDKLPDDLGRLLPLIERAVPAGVGKGHDRAGNQALAWLADHQPGSKLSPKQATTAAVQFGTLGSGNHFFEICVDELDMVWIVLHSGSRGIGNQLAQVHIAKAKRMAKDMELGVEDPDLAYFVQGTDAFEAYLTDMLWAQEWAFANRQQMMHSASRVILKELPPGTRVVDTINCHHNFTAREVHDGVELWITRKGAIRARESDRGVIPGSMGTRTYIVRGAGHPESWMSCSHGAGRRMSRGEARRTFTATDLKRAMEGRAWQADKAGDLVDEIPASYKDIDQVMADQRDLVTVESTLHQVLNYKGS
jgi:tRNA-splicing ligase RtcB